MVKHPTITFNDCKNVGDNIDALTRYYTTYQTLNTYILETVLENIKKNNDSIDAHKEKLLSDMKTNKEEADE